MMDRGKLADRADQISVVWMFLETLEQCRRPSVMTPDEKVNNSVRWERVEEGF